MKPNLPAPPASVFGFRCVIVEEADIDQELLDRFQFAKPCEIGTGIWELYRPPNEDEGVPIPGTRGMTLPGDHRIHDLEKLI